MFGPETTLHERSGADRGGAEHPIHVVPSLLSSDFARLGEEVRRAEAAGADWHHVDVMDGHFVPNLTLGPPVVERIHAVAERPLDVHLMIEEPWEWAERYARAGAHALTFHLEACPGPDAARRTARAFRDAGVALVGVSMNPDTNVERVAELLDAVDMVLVMSVFPGFAGQSFMPEVLQKTEWLRAQGFAGRVEMDGGLDMDTMPLCVEAGADTLVAGSSLYGPGDMEQRLREFRRAADEALERRRRRGREA